MGQIDRLNVVLVSPTRADLDEPFHASWFDHFMHAVGASNGTVNWQHEHRNQLEAEHHFCVAINNEGSFQQLVVLMDELLQTMPTEMLRHTLFGCYALEYRFNREDRALPYETSMTVEIGWTLVLPNVTTNALHNVMHQLPMNGEMYASC